MKKMGGWILGRPLVLLVALGSPVLALAMPAPPVQERPTAGHLVERPVERRKPSSKAVNKPQVPEDEARPGGAHLPADEGPPTYRIGKEDVLQVVVFGEESLSQPRVPVRPDGRISLPLLGDIQAEGKTPEELAHGLTQRYKAHVRAPSVSVTVVEVKSFKVFLVGKVKTPGVLTFGRQTSLLQALAQAGGFAEFANTKRILIIREGLHGPQRILINYEKIITGADLSMNIKLQPGDTIVVP